MNRGLPIAAIGVALVTLAFVVSPAFVPFAGFDPTLYPVPQFDPPVQPAGYAFAIWGPIYIWLLASAGFGLLRRRSTPAWSGPRPWLIVSIGVGATWLAVAQVSPVWATILIWVMLLAALAAVFKTPVTDRWLLQAPVALYAGWLTAASFVSLGMLGAGYGIVTGEVGWAWAALSGALTFGAAVQIRLKRAPEYGAALVWALIAVAVKNWDVEPAIAAFAIAGAGIMAALALRAMRG
jgi:hypothetical protein